MELKELKEVLESLKANAESFLTGDDDDDEVWKKDIEAVDQVVALLDNLEEYQRVIGYREFLSRLIAFEKSVTKPVADLMMTKFMDSPQGTFLSDFFEDSNFDLRRCTHCGEVMTKGYCIDAGSEYYCSDECLHEHYTEEEYLEMYDDGNGDSYYTEWEDVEKP